jgi:hypothetical protein
MRQLSSINASHANRSNADYARASVATRYHAGVRVFERESDQSAPEPKPVFGFSNRAYVGAETHKRTAVKIGFRA